MHTQVTAPASCSRCLQTSSAASASASNLGAQVDAVRAQLDEANATIADLQQREKKLKERSAWPRSFAYPSPLSAALSLSLSVCVCVCVPKQNRKHSEPKERYVSIGSSTNLEVCRSDAGQAVA